MPSYRSQKEDNQQKFKVGKRVMLKAYPYSRGSVIATYPFRRLVQFDEKQNVEGVGRKCWVDLRKLKTSPDDDYRRHRLKK